MTLVQQLNKVYIEQEHWQSHKETLAGITNYHQAMLDKGNIHVYVDYGELLGYFEVWKVKIGQVDKVLYGKFIAPFEDTTSGSVAFLANLWIREDKRKGEVFRVLKDRFFDYISDCSMIVGEETKYGKRLKMFHKRRQLWEVKNNQEARLL